MKRFIKITALLLAFILSVMPVGVSAENERLENAKKTLTFKQLSSEDIGSVTQNLVLPVRWADCVIVWESENENLLEIVQGGETLICRCLRPPFGEGDATAILKAVIIDGGEFVTKSFAVGILENEIGYIYSSPLTRAKEQFDFDFLSAQNIFEIRDDIVIPTVSEETVEMSMETDRPEIISADGKVTRNAQNDETVCLTATFRVGNEYLKRSYPVIVKALDEEEIKNKLHEDVVNAKNALLEKYNTSGLTQNIELPRKGENTSAFSWTSSSPSVIEDDGTIHRSDSMGEATLTLTATLEGVSETITVDVRVAKRESQPQSTQSSGSGPTLIKPSQNDTSTPVTEIIPSFSDVPESHWAFDEIEEMKKREILDGTGDGKFLPDMPVTREQTLKLIVNTLDVVHESEQNPFTDVEENAWYTTFVKTCYGAGIVKGMSENFFGVGVEISRQDFCVMLLNAMEYCSDILPEETGKEFSDSGSVALYAQRAVATLSAAGIIGGMPDGSFMPLKNMTRAEAAVVLYRVLKK